MIPVKKLLLTVFILFIYCSSALGATPSNTGFGGLWEYPTAELPGDGAGWIHYARYQPFRTYAANLGLFPWLEFNLRMTEYENDEIKNKNG